MRRVRARKAHRCAGCGAVIAPGETYERFASLYDGSWSVERGCLACGADADKFGEAHGDMSFFPSGFADALSDCVNEEDPEDAKWLPMLEALQSRRERARLSHGG